MQGRDIKEKVPPTQEGPNPFPNKKIHIKNYLSREKTIFSQNIFVLQIEDGGPQGKAMPLLPFGDGFLSIVPTYTMGKDEGPHFSIVPNPVPLSPAAGGWTEKGGFKGGLPPLNRGGSIKFTSYCKLKKVKKTLKSKNQVKNGYW